MTSQHVINVNSTLQHYIMMSQQTLETDGASTIIKQAIQLYS